MKKISVFISFFCLLFVIFFLSFTPSIFAQSHYRYINDPKTAVYFGHISYTEVQHDGKDPVVLREGKTKPEVAVLNLPIAPGDTVSTPVGRRCEIQFDTGTIIRLDTNTEVKVETILAQSLTSASKITNFVLNKGQIYVMYKQYSSSEILQILFSNASAKFKHKSVLTMRANMDGSTDIKVDTGQVSVLYGPEGHLKKIALKRLDEVTVSIQNEILYAEYEEGVDFSLWNLGMNKNFLTLHKGISNLPKPIQRMSPAVFNFAQRFSYLHGEWLWNEIYGYVWRPFTNDQYLPGVWQPYYYGQWRKINDDLFWVPQESWGWVPYHLGVWVWDKKTGWLWIPGSAFAPGWVTWNFYMGHFSWRPLILFDWLFAGVVFSYLPRDIADGVFVYDRGNDDIQSDGSGQNKKSILYKIRKNQLKKNNPTGVTPTKEMRKVLANLVRALKDGDTSILSSMKEMPKKTLVVQGDHLSSSSLNKMMMELDQMSAIVQGGLMQRDPLVDPLGYARMAFRRKEWIVSLAQNTTIDQADISGEIVSQNRWVQPTVWVSEGMKSNVKRQPSPERGKLGVFVNDRFRDCNPDVKVAHRIGVTIKYSSLKNAIRVPELEKISSDGRKGTFNFSRARAERLFSTSSGGSSSSSSSSGSSSSRSSGSSSSKSSSASSSASKTIKKI